MSIFKHYILNVRCIRMVDEPTGVSVRSRVCVCVRDCVSAWVRARQRTHLRNKTRVMSIWPAPSANEERRLVRLASAARTHTRVAYRLTQRIDQYATREHAEQFCISCLYLLLKRRLLQICVSVFQIILQNLVANFHLDLANRVQSWNNFAKYWCLAGVYSTR